MGLNLVHLFAHLSWPVMPAMAKTMHEAIQPVGYRNGVINWPDMPMAEYLDQLEAGQPVAAPDVLISKITEDQIAEWKMRFNGAS
jgi:methionyl-tRNA synthetase